MSEQNTSLYECHITVNAPKSKSEKMRFKKLAKEHKWKTSAIDGDPLLGDKVYFYFTCHNVDFDSIFNKMEALSGILRQKVVRKKIEHIVFDTKKKFK